MCWEPRGSGEPGGGADLADRRTPSLGRRFRAVRHLSISWPRG